MSIGTTFNRKEAKSRNNSFGQVGGLNRPRRFSLLYSSSDDDDDDNTSENFAALKQRRKSKSVTKPNNAGASNKSELKMMALRNKLKLLQSANTKTNKTNSTLHNDHLINNNTNSTSLQSTAKKRKPPQHVISSSSSDDDDNYEDETSSDEEKQVKPFALNTNESGRKVDLKTVSDLSEPSPSPELSKSMTVSDEDVFPKSASHSSEELNEKELLKAISSESDVEKEEEEGIMLEDDFSMDLDIDLDLEDEKQKGNVLEMFSNVEVVPNSKNHTEIYVAEDDDEDEELNINLGKDNEDKNFVDDTLKEHLEEDDDGEEEDYNEMLLEAALLTDSESNNGHLIPSSLSNNDTDEDENVFINVDDLDPQSFYFENEEDDDNMEESNNSKNAFFQDEESTDEEEELPEISNKIKTRTRSIHNLHDSAFGKNLPKLNCWKADLRKPFSIIDGLSTKSLYSIAIEDDEDDENLDSSSISNDNSVKGNLLTPAIKPTYSAGINSTVFSARANISNQLLEEVTSNDTTPKLRSNGNTKSSQSVTAIPDFPMDQLIDISSSSEDDDEEEDEDSDDNEETNGEQFDQNEHQLPPSVANSTEEIQMVFHKDKKDKDDGNEDLFTQNGLTALMNNELIIEFSADSGLSSLEQLRRHSISNLQNHSGNSKLDSKLASADFALIQQLTQPQIEVATGAAANRRGSVILEEAKEGNLRYTKSGLFSEAAMMNLEEFINNSSNNGNEVQFEVDGISFS